MPANILDRAIAWASPKRGAERMLARMRLERADSLNRFYQASSAGRTDGWVITGGDANAQVITAASRVREAAHDLVRNNPWATKAVDTWKACAGPISVRSQLPGPQPFGRIKGGPADQIDTLWYEHWQACGAAGLETDCEVQVGGIGALIESGEYLVRRIDEPMASGLPVPMSLQLLEPDYLDTTRDVGVVGDDTFTLGGIKFDRRGRRIGYWLYREHPAASLAFTRRALESVLVPADEVAHVFEKRRPGQVRGISWFAPAVMRLHDLDAYDSYELIRKKAEACLVAVVFGDDPAQTIGGVGDASPGDPVGAAKITDSYGTRIESFEPGMIVYSQGRDIRMTEPKGATDTGFTRAQLHACAAALGLTYERLTGDLSQVSFISGRMGELQFRPRVKQIQQTVLMPRHMDRVWAWWTRAAYAAGRIDQPVVWARYGAPPWESIQPLDDATAALLEVRMGARSMQGLLAERGEDWLERLDEVQEWNAEIDRRKIVLDSDPRALSRSGAAQPSPKAPSAGAPDAAGDGAPVDPTAPAQANGRSADGMITEALKLVNGRRLSEYRNHGH